LPVAQPILAVLLLFSMDIPKNRTGKIACATKAVRRCGRTDRLCDDLFSALEFKWLERAVLCSNHQLAVKRAFRWAAIESLFRRKASEIRIIIFLRKMRQHKIARARVKTFRIAKIFADGMIREMPRAAENALFNDPRIRADFEHVQIVVRFEQQAIRVAQMNLHKLGHIAKIRDERHLRAIGTKRETNRIGGVVRNLKRVNIDIANGEVLAGLNRLHAAQTLPKPVGQSTVQRLHGAFRNIQRSLPKPEHLRKAIAVVAMFVGNQDPVDAINVLFDSSEAGESFAFTEAAVHEESGALRLEQCDVARAA
jgi:hypothetical protein